MRQYNRLLFYNKMQLECCASEQLSYPSIPLNTPWFHLKVRPKGDTRVVDRVQSLPR